MGCGGDTPQALSYSCPGYEPSEESPGEIPTSQALPTVSPLHPKVLPCQAQSIWGAGSFSAPHQGLKGPWALICPPLHLRAHCENGSFLQEAVNLAGSLSATEVNPSRRPTSRLLGDLWPRRLAGQAREKTGQRNGLCAAAAAAGWSPHNLLGPRWGIFHPLFPMKMACV